MSFKVARLIRLFIGALLPVPLFIVIYYFSYFYKSYHGYSYEIHAYLTDEMSLSNSRKLVWQDMSVFLFFGYTYMLIPSILYAILLEVYRAKPFSGCFTYVALGGIIGGFSSILFLWINPGGFVTDILSAFLALILSVFIGATVAMLLSLIGRPRLKKRIDGLRSENAA